ncbi:MAG: NACHT domain-containing protein [Cyanobacteria bacterium P01_A01_bin.114]
MSQPPLPESNLPEPDFSEPDPLKSDSLKPEPHLQVENSTLEGVNIVQGQGNRSVQGDENQVVMGDRNVVTQIKGDRNLLVNVQNLIWGRTDTSAGPARPRPERLLLQDVQQEVNARLKQSLHQAAFINLEKTLSLQEIQTMWAAEVKTGRVNSAPESTTAAIADLFDQADGRLLMLGGPGAGKTTTLLNLAQTLTARAQQQLDYPIPVLLSLSIWQAGQLSLTSSRASPSSSLMSDWIISTLKQKYGVSAQLSQTLLAERRLLPLLDGLDEAAPDQQAQCLSALDLWLWSEQRPTYVVLCSRLEEFRQLDTPLLLNQAVVLEPLTEAQIRTYLASIEAAELWPMIAADANLLDLAQTPLWLSLFVLTYHSIALDRWQQLTTTAARLTYLLDAYIQQMLHRSGPAKSSFTPAQTRYWLTQLAQHLQTHAADGFLIESLQTQDWLSPRQQKQHALVNTLISGAIPGFLMIMWTYFMAPRVFENVEFKAFDTVGWMIATGITWGALGILVASIQPAIHPIESIRWSWPQARRKFLGRLLTWLGFWALMWYINGIFIAWMNLPDEISEVPVWLVVIGIGLYATVQGLILGLVYGLLTTVILEGFIGGLIGPKIDIKRFPNQGIRRSAVNMLWFLGFGALASFVAGGLLAMRVAPHIPAWQYGLSVMPVWGSVAALLGGGKACLQHGSLRWMLYRQGKLPWNLARFLNDCTDRLLLQCVGGRYRFIHQTLQAHFAEMPGR